MAQIANLDWIRANSLMTSTISPAASGTDFAFPSPNISRSKPKGDSQAVSQICVWALIAIITVLPLDFFPGLGIDQYYVKLLYIATAASFATLPLLSRNSISSRKILTIVATAYLVRLVTLALSLGWSSNPSLGATMLVLEVAALTLATPLFLILGRCDLDRFAHIVFWGTFGGALCFHLFLAFGHLSAGRISIIVLFEAIASGELRVIKLQYFVGGLRGLGVEGVSGLWGSISPKITNAFGNGLITPAILAVHLAGADKALNRTSSTARRLATWFIVLNTVLVILFAFSSRVQVYALLIIMMHAFFYGFLGANRKVRFLLLYTAALGIGLAIIYMLYNLAALGGLSTFITNFINDPRFNDLHETIYRVSSSGFFGDGFGTALNLSDANNLFPHNLFLSDLLAGGIPGLLVSFIWCGALTYCAILGFGIMINRNLPQAVRRLGLAGFTTVFYNVLLMQLTSRGALDLSSSVGLSMGLAAVALAMRLAKQTGRGPRMAMPFTDQVKWRHSQAGNHGQHRV